MTDTENQSTEHETGSANELVEFCPCCGEEIIDLTHISPSKGEVTIREAIERIEALGAALQAITDHFADVMAGPMITGRGVVFANGIPTISKARALLRSNVRISDETPRE